MNISSLYSAVFLALKVDRITPKAFANLSPGLECSDNPGNFSISSIETLKGFVPRQTPSGFKALFAAYPGLSPRSNPGLKLANAFGVILNSHQQTKGLRYE